MSEIYVKYNLVIEYINVVNWNQVFNKIKPNFEDFYYEDLLNNCINYLIKISQVLFTRSSVTKIKENNLQASNK